jgi:hypothetical protein
MNSLYKKGQKVVFDNPTEISIKNEYESANQKVNFGHKIAYGKVIDIKRITLRSSSSIPYEYYKNIIEIQLSNGERISINDYDLCIRRPTLIKRLTKTFQ